MVLETRTNRLKRLCFKPKIHSSINNPSSITAPWLKPHKHSKKAVLEPTQPPSPATKLRTQQTSRNDLQYALHCNLWNSTQHTSKRRRANSSLKSDKKASRADCKNERKRYNNNSSLGAYCSVRPLITHVKPDSKSKLINPQPIFTNKGTRCFLPHFH